MNNLEKAKELKERFENSKRICKSVNPEVWLVSEEYQFNMKTLEKLKELLEEIKEKLKICEGIMLPIVINPSETEKELRIYLIKKNDKEIEDCQEAIKICEEILK